MTTAAATAPSPAQAGEPSGSYYCPICKSRHRTLGWVLWHLRKAHEADLRDSSPARARGRKPTHLDAHTPEDYARSYGRYVRP